MCIRPSDETLTRAYGLISFSNSRPVPSGTKKRSAGTANRRPPNLLYWPATNKDPVGGLSETNEVAVKMPRSSAVSSA